MTQSAALPQQPPLIVEQIKGKIRARIGTHWRIGDRLPPLDVLARELGVGEKNTYVAVQELAREGLLASRRRQGTYVADRPAAASPSKKRRHVIHLPLGPDRDGMIQRMARAFINEMSRRGREVRIGPDLPNLPDDLDLRDFNADAVVLINSTTSRVRPAAGAVYAVIDTSGRPPRGLDHRYDVVGPDNEQGGMLAGECLRKFGITDPAFAGVGRADTGFVELDAQRLQGFERGFGRPLAPARKFMVGTYSEDEGARLARKYAGLTSRPEALFVASDEIAAGFRIGGAVLDLEPRRDYLLMGFDGQSRVVAAAGNGGVTTVAVPAEAMGRQAAEFLDMRLEHPDLPPRSMSLGCAVRRGKTTPRPVSPAHPFFPDASYWPAPPDAVFPVESTSETAIPMSLPDTHISSDKGERS